MKNKLFVLVGLAVFILILGVLFVQSVKMEQDKNVMSEKDQIQEITDSDWVKGSKEARVKIVEYSDLQCPACRAYYPVSKQIMEEFKDSTAFVYRHFPLRTIHPNAQLASQTAQAAGKQGKFWEMHDLLFDKQEEWAEVLNPRELFNTYAQSLGLDLEKFKTDLESEEVKNDVDNNYQDGVQAGVNATPTFFINGKKIQNPRSLEDFRSIIQKALKNE